MDFNKEYRRHIERINARVHDEALRQLDYDLLAQRACADLNTLILIKNQQNMQRIMIRYYSHLGGTPKAKELINTLCTWKMVSAVKVEIATDTDIEAIMDVHSPQTVEFIAAFFENTLCGYVISELDRPTNTWRRIHSQNHPSL